MDAETEQRSPLSPRDLERASGDLSIMATHLLSPDLFTRERLLAYCKEQYQTLKTVERLLLDAAHLWIGAAANQQPIDTAPLGKSILLFIYLPKNPPASGWIIGSLSMKRPSEYWTNLPKTLTELPDGAPRSEATIWDGHQYRPNMATHWMPLPPPAL